MKRVALVALLAFLSACGTTRGVWVRVAETTCDALVELVDADDVIRKLCLVTVDLVTLLAELRAAERDGRDVIVNTVDGNGDPTTITVPVRHVPAAVLSVRAAMGAR